MNNPYGGNLKLIQCIGISVDASRKPHIQTQQKWLYSVSHGCECIHTIHKILMYIRRCACVSGILYKWVGWAAVLINLLLLKQSKCKLDLSICVSQTIMRREFKWPGCFSSILTQSWNLQRDDFCVNKKKLCIGKENNPHRLYWRLIQYKVCQDCGT